jgi:adenylosuccinate lyase
MTLEELKKSMEPSRYTGRAKEQTIDFVNEVIQPILEENKDLLGLKADIKV